MCEPEGYISIPKYDNRALPLPNPFGRGIRRFVLSNAGR